MKILLIGPQGSGKSTQAQLLGENLGLPIISVGDIFRQIAVSDTDEARRIKQILDSGQLVDDQTTAELIKKRVNEEDMKDGFIMDGYPRTMEQASIFDPSFDKVIYLEIPREEVVERLMKRGRADDTALLINQRLDLYYQQTQPLLDYYKQKGLLMTLDGKGSIEEIQDKIKSSLSSLLHSE